MHRCCVIFIMRRYCQPPYVALRRDLQTSNCIITCCAFFINLPLKVAFFCFEYIHLDPSYFCTPSLQSIPLQNFEIMYSSTNLMMFDVRSCHNSMASGVTSRSDEVSPRSFLLVPKFTLHFLKGVNIGTLNRLLSL